MIAIDTNLLIYAHRSAVTEHKAARSAIQRAARSSAGWGIALPVIGEFWSVATHPSCLGGPSTPGQAASFLRSLLDSGAGAIWQPGPDFGVRLVQLACDLKVIGTRIFDLQIALVAYENGATEIWTHDADFITIPGLQTLDPL